MSKKLNKVPNLKDLVDALGINLGEDIEFSPLPTTDYIKCSPSDAEVYKQCKDVLGYISNTGVVFTQNTEGGIICYDCETNSTGVLR